MHRGWNVYKCISCMSSMYVMHVTYVCYACAHMYGMNVYLCMSCICTCAYPVRVPMVKKYKPKPEVEPRVSR